MSAQATRIGAVVGLVVWCATLLWEATLPVRLDDGVKDPRTFVEAFAAVANDIPPHSLVVVQPPWRDDVKAILQQHYPAFRWTTAFAWQAPHNKSRNTAQALYIIADRTIPIPGSFRTEALTSTNNIIVGRLLPPEAESDGAPR